MAKKTGIFHSLIAGALISALLIGSVPVAAMAEEPGEAVGQVQEEGNFVTEEGDEAGIRNDTY